MFEVKNIFNKKEKRLVSLGFGGGFIKAVYLELKGQAISALNCALESVQGLSEGERKDKAGEFIRRFLLENNIKEKETHLTIAGPGAVFIKHITIPFVPKKEIAGAIQWQLRGNIPFEANDVISDWQIVREYTDPDGARKYNIVFLAMKLEVINQYISLAQACGLNPVHISAAPFNYAWLLKYTGKAQEAYLVMDIGYKGTNLCFYRDHKLLFVRSLPYSAQKMAASIATTLATDAGKVELTYEEAEEIMRTSGIPLDTEVEIKKGIKGIQLISLMRPNLEMLAREVSRTTEYIKEYLKEGQPQTLYITGGGSRLKNLDNYLEDKIKIKVAALSELVKMDSGCFINGKDGELKEQLFSAIGCGAADTSVLNLAPPELKAKKIEEIKWATLRVGAVVITVVLMFFIFIAHFMVRDYSKRLKNATSHLAMIKEIKILKNRLDEREALVSLIEKDSVPADGLFKALSRIVPANIVLDKLSLQQKKGMLILEGVVLKSGLVAEDTLAEFIKKLEASSFISDASMASSEKDSDKQRFEIVCILAR